jgi:YqaJ-like viral recombinase domain
MTIHTCTQGSVEWLKLRSGIPTASEFSRIVTPGGKLSKQAEGYMFHLLAEFVVGHPFETAETQWMERGALLEADAVRAYEFQKDVDTEIVGFVTNDAGTIGCSPDRLVGADRLCEIKAPKHNTQVGYMLTGSIEDDYLPQLQGQLWLTGRDWVDVVSFHPEFPLVVIPVARNEQYIATLKDAVESFVDVMMSKRAELETRYGPFVRPGKEADADPFHVSEKDVDAIWQAAELSREQAHGNQ